MQTHFDYVPVDRTTIKSRLGIHPDLFDNPNAYIRKRELPVRTSKFSRGTSKRGPTQNLTLDVLAYKGIKVELRKISGDPLTDTTIHFTPCNCLFGHNGFVLSLTEFLDTLAILSNNLKPLLSNDDDWVDLIPGLRSGGVAYWDYIEAHFQCDDPDGRLLAGFRHARHPDIRTPARHWSESIVFGAQRSKLTIGIYRKAVEMVAHGKLNPERLADFQHVLRLEVRLMEDKLVHYFGNERNVEIIGNVSRLVRFYPGDLVTGQRSCLGAFQGVYASDEPLGEVKPGAQNIHHGRMLARVALDQGTSQSFPELLEQIKHYTGASSDTMAKVRKAGLELLSHRSPISKDELFSDAAYQAQHQVASEEQERKVCHEIEDTAVHRQIFAAYCPPEQPFQPITKWPSYLRY